MTVSVKAGMTDQTSSNVARSGAAKRPQTSFPIKSGMKDQTAALSGVSPANPGVGPDAAPANPLAKVARGKACQTEFSAKWGATDADGRGVDSGLGKKVLAEAASSFNPNC